MCINMQSLFVCWNIHFQYLYSLWPPRQLICSGRVCVRITSPGTMIDGSLETLLPLASSGMGVIFCHLAGVLLQLEEVEVLTSSMGGDFLELEPGVTPAIGTWGGATMVDDVEARKEML